MQVRRESTTRLRVRVTMMSTSRVASGISPSGIDLCRPGDEPQWPKPRVEMVSRGAEKKAQANHSLDSSQD